MVRWLARRAVLVGLLTLVAAACPRLVPARASGMPATLKTYTSVTNRYTIRYPGTWVLGTHIPITPGKPEPKLPKYSVTLSTPGAVASGNVKGLVAIVVTPNRFSAAEVNELAANFFSSGATAGPVRHGTRVIHGVTFSTARATLHISQPSESLDASVLAARHGGLTYFIFGAIVGGPGSAALAAQSAAIIGSLQLQ